MLSPTAYQLAAPADPTETSHQHQKKRLRLSVACNQCRKRKVRCDTKLPKCSHCEARNETCEASDPRYPEKGTVVRSVANRKSQPPPAPPPAPAPVSVDPKTYPSSNNKSNHGKGTKGSSHDLGRASDISPRGSTTDINPRASVSWVSRAYQENNAAVHPAGSENDLQSPDPEVIVNTDDTSYRVKFLGGSSLQGLCSFVDLQLLSKGLEPVSPKFKNGMKHSEEFPFHILHRLPLLPDRGFISACIDTFVDRVWPLFPLVDMSVLQPEIERIVSLQAVHSADFIAHLSPASIPTLACIYAIVCIGADEMAGRASETTTSLLGGIYGLYGFLVAHPYILSVQALCLLALALRGQMKDGQAWQVLGQAIRIAQSIGLHRTIPKQTGGTATAYDHASPSLRNVELRHRVWWSCFAFERVMQLEAGRPSLVSSDGNDYDENDDDGSEDPLAPPIFDPASPTVSTNKPDYFAAWVTLSRIMGRISDWLYSRRPRSSLELFRRVESLYQSLEKWSEFQSSCGTVQLQDSVVDADQSNHEDEEKARHLRGFLSMYFHFTRIMLLRLCLIFPPKSYAAELSRQRDHLRSPQSSYPKLANAADMCAQSARKTITECLYFVDQADSSESFVSLFSTQTPMFLSTIVLALVLLRRPGRRLARADMELVRVSGEFVDDSFARWGLGGMPMGRAIHGQVQRFLEQYERNSRNGNGAAASMVGAGACSNSRPTIMDPVDNEGDGCYSTMHLDSTQCDSAMTAAGINSMLEGGMMGAAMQQMGGDYPAEPLEGLEFNDLWDILGVGIAGTDLRL